MNGILLAFLLTLIGAINLNFYQIFRGKFRTYIRDQLRFLRIGVLVAAILAYIYMPPLIFPDIFVSIGIMLTINAIFNIVNIKGKDLFRKGKIDLIRLRLPITLIFILLILLIFTPIYPLTQTQILREIPDAEVSGQKILPMDPDHIRQVPLEFAAWKADKIIGDLGFKTQVGRLSIQIINDKSSWVAPFEFSNIWKWFQYKSTPGYVIVDAENPDSVAERVDTLNLKYLTTAWFQSNLYRHVYQEYPNFRLQDFTFELNNDKKPYWVVSAVRPTLWFTGEKVSGVIIVDPQTGEMNYYKIGNVPDWVDRVIPENLAENYNYWYGAYVHGYWNTLFSQKDMHVPTKKNGRIDVFGVRGDEGFLWFTGHTSPSSSDKSLAGYATIDTKTGEMIYYQNVSGYYNEEAALANVNSKVSNFQGYYSTQPIFYNLYGELTWIVPVLSNNNQLQRIGLVHAETGFTILGDNLNYALEKYRTWLLETKDIEVSEDRNIGDLVEIEGKVKRIKDDMLIIDSVPRHIFRISGIEALITEAGDKVYIEYIEDENVIVEVDKFDNLDFNY